MLVTLLCESAKTVLKMNSVILILFLGATVAFAEISVENDPHHHKPRCPLKVSSSLAASEKILLSALTVWLSNFFFLAHGQSYTSDKPVALELQIALEFRNVDFCGGENTGEPGEKRSGRDENQQQTQPTYDTGSRIWTRATFVGGKRDHHWATPAPLFSIEFIYGLIVF